MGLYIGLMSGTSIDGIDAALLDSDTQQLVAGHIQRYPAELKAELQVLMQSGSCNLASLCQLNQKIGLAFAEAALALLAKTGVSASEIQAIGSHGQTVCHDAFAQPAYTLQLGCPHTIAAVTGIKVVADFRTADLLRGGQGAPFAPLYHATLLASVDKPIAVVNIGGLANVTILNDSGCLGFDTGPGNCLLDAWIAAHQGRAYDDNGSWAASGMPIPALMARLLADPYFERAAPKSLGKEYFNSEWLQSRLEPGYAPEDVQASLLALTAITIAEAVKGQETEIKALYLCGGGAHNQALVQALEQALAAIPVMRLARLGHSVDYLEAQLFAWLAERRLAGVPMDLRAITGSKQPGLLGVVYPADITV